MSGPYDAYGGPAYNPPQGFNQYPYGAPPQQGYPQQQYGGGYPTQDFGPPHGQDSFGPPQQGGFQHGQAGGQYGAYDASNPQGHAGYYGGPAPPSSQPHQQHQGGGAANPGYDAFLENQRYQQGLHQAGTNQQQQPPYDAQGQQNHQLQAQSSDPNAPNYDPSAPPMTETDRGLLGAIGGGVAGHFMGKKANHGFLGTVGGGILGSLAEDFLKDKRRSSPSRHHHSSHHHSHHGSQHSGQNTWGGGSKW